MKSGGSVPYSQGLSNNPYPEPNQRNQSIGDRLRITPLLSYIPHTDIIARMRPSSVHTYTFIMSFSLFFLHDLVQKVTPDRRI